MKNTYPEKQLIAESEHYCIKGEWETASLYSKKENKPITCVRDHYGDTADGLIDRNERFCVTVGCGYIVYFLNEPFEPYAYDRSTPQWTESGRENSKIKWIEKVRQISDNEVELTDEHGNREVIRIP